MGNSSSSSTTSSYGMVVREAESPFAPPRGGVFRRKAGDDGGVHLVRSSDGVAGETRRTVSRYDVTQATPSIGGQPGTFTRIGSFMVHPDLDRIRSANDIRSSSPLSGGDFRRRGSPASSSQNSFVSLPSMGGDENLHVNDFHLKNQTFSNNEADSGERFSGCQRCAERRSKISSSTSRNNNINNKDRQHRRGSDQKDQKERRLSARNALFDSGRGPSSLSGSTPSILNCDDDACSCASFSSYHSVAEDVDLYPFFELDPTWLRNQGNPIALSPFFVFSFQRESRKPTECCV